MNREHVEKYIRYFNDPIYMIKDCFTVQDATVGKTVAFELFEKQEELIYKFENGKHVICNKSRQSGISTTTAAYIAAKMAMASPDDPMHVIIVANKAAQAQDFLSKIKGFLSQVPIWVWGEYYDHSKTIDGHIIGKGSIKDIKLLNGSKANAVATSKDAVRGASSPRIIVIDEAAHIDKTDGETMFASAMMALSSNTSGQMFLISTPNSQDPIFYKTYNESLANGGDNNFEIHEIYYFQDPRYNKNLRWEYKDENGEKVIEVETEFDCDKMAKKYKLGWTPISDWFMKQAAILHHNQVQINRELLCRFDGSGNNVVDFEHIRRQETKNVLDPIRKEWHDKLLWIWADPKEGHQYAAAVDVSTGDGDDYCSLQIVDLTDEEQVLEYKGKQKSELFAEMIQMYCNRYSSICEIDITGGYGENLVSDLKKIKFKFFVKTEKTEKENYDDAKFGFCFSVSSRPKIFTRFVAYVEGPTFKIRSIRTIAELNTFLWINGRPDHMRGFNDDAICALALCIWTIETKFRQLKAASDIDRTILDYWLTPNTPPVMEPTITKVEKQFNTKVNPNPNRRPTPIYQNGVNISDCLWLFAKPNGNKVRRN